MKGVFPYFNSRPSARGDLTGTPIQNDTRISIHAPPRGATFGTCNQVDFLQISIHAPPRGATMPGFASGSPCLFQFTPLREGRQFVTPGFTGVPISIHAPPRGATAAGRSGGGVLEHFNSRPSARGDVADALEAMSEGISIHAPPRGATACRFLVFCGFPFQFTPLREGRRCMTRTDGGICKFQFTPLREGRRKW